MFLMKLNHFRVAFSKKLRFYTNPVIQREHLPHFPEDPPRRLKRTRSRDLLCVSTLVET